VEEVALLGCSAQQQQYIRSQLDALGGVGATMIFVFDGHSYPPKQATQGARRADQAAARQQAIAAQSRSAVAGADKAWMEAGSSPTRAVHALASRGVSSTISVVCCVLV